MNRAQEHPVDGAPSAAFVAQPESFRLNYIEAGTDTSRPTLFVTTADAPGTVIVMQR